MAGENRGELEWPSRSGVQRSAKRHQVQVIKVGEKSKPKIGKKTQAIAAGALAIGGLATVGAIEVKEKVEDTVAEARRLLSHQEHKELTQGPKLKIERPENEFDIVYGDLSPLENSKALDNILYQESIIAERYLDREHIELVKKYESLIRASAREKGVPEDLLLGLVIIESRGEPRAESNQELVFEERARGLTQMMIPMAEKYGLVVSEHGRDDRYIPEKILPATAAELRESYEVLGDWGLAFQEWHLGRQQLFDAISLYLEEKEEGLENVDITKKVISENGVNIHRLFDKVGEGYTGESWNETTEYVARLVAGSIYYKANRDLA